MTCLDTLPIELIHRILNYLDCHDIFIFLTNTNSYLNTVLTTYERYKLNFQSITMSQFYSSLHHIRPHQVVSLTLSNMNETPGQFQLFLSLFSLKQFTNLQSLQLIQPPNPIEFNIILTDLHTLASLRSLAIIHCQPSSVNQETFLLLSSLINTSASLSRLYLSGALNTIFEYDFNSSKIDHLYFNDNIFNTISLQTITARMPQLTSLNTGITSTMNYQHLPSLVHLTRLTITSFVNTTNSDLKILFSKMPVLVFFKFIANGKQWFNGHFWEECLPLTLRTFQFNFCTQSIHIHEDMILDTFRTSFWLENKRWYVMLDYQTNPAMTHLYSLPYCDTQFCYRPSMDPTHRLRSTLPLDKSYMNKVTRLTMDLSTLITECKLPLSAIHFFPNVSTLILADNGCCPLSIQRLFNFLESSVDLSHITELKLGQFHHPEFIRILYNRMPRLNSIRIAESLFSKLETLDFCNIRSLTICDCLTDVERMCSMFSHLKYLCVRLITFEHIQKVIRLLEKTLINVTFRHINQELQEKTIKWLYEHCGKHRQFSYDTDQHMDLHIWLYDFF